MKQNLIAIFTALFVLVSLAQADVVGYTNYRFYSGYNLFENTFDGTPDNSLTTIFSGSIVPDGTTVSLWDPSTVSFDTTSVFTGGSWSLNLVLNPGTGARLYAPAIFTNTFAGNVVNRDGTFFQGTEVLPPVYSGPNGVLLLGDMLPTSDTGTNIFLNLIGRAPNPGEQVSILDEATQVVTTSTYLGSGFWNTATPTLNLGEAAYLNVGPVPEPATLALGALAVGLMIFFLRKPDLSKPS